MIDEQEYKALRKKAEDAKTQQDRAAGQLEAAMQRLDEEFGCASLEEADHMQRKLDRNAAKAESCYNEALEEFKAKWGDKLDE